MGDTVFSDQDKINLLFKRFMGVSCTKVTQGFTTEQSNAFNPVLSHHIWSDSGNIPAIPPTTPNNFDICGAKIDDNYSRTIQYYDNLELEPVVNNNPAPAWWDPPYRKFISNNGDSVTKIKNENLEIRLYKDKNLTVLIDSPFYTSNIKNILGIHIAKRNGQPVDYPFNFNSLFSNETDIRGNIITNKDLVYSNLTSRNINQNYLTNKAQFITDIDNIDTTNMTIKLINNQVYFDNIDDIFCNNIINSTGFTTSLSNKNINILNVRGNINTFNVGDQDISFAWSSNADLVDTGWTSIPNNQELQLNHTNTNIKIYKYYSNTTPNDTSNHVIFSNINPNGEFDITGQLENSSKILIRNNTTEFEFLNSNGYIDNFIDISNTVDNDFTYATVIKLDVLIDDSDYTGYITNKIEGSRLKNILYYPYSKMYGARVKLFDSVGGSLPAGVEDGGNWIVDPSTGILTFHSFDNITLRVDITKKPKLTFFRYIGKSGIGGGLFDADAAKNMLNIRGSALITDGLQVNKQSVFNGDVTFKQGDDGIEILKYDSNKGIIYMGSDDHDNGLLSNYPAPAAVEEHPPPAVITDGKFVLDISGNMRGDNAEFVDTIHAREIITWSDRKLKENICQMELNLDNTSKMRGVHFVWKDTGKEDIGFIAQEVEEIFPQIVHNTRSGYKAISYEKMIPILLEYIKSVEGRVKYLEDLLSKK